MFEEEEEEDTGTCIKCDDKGPMHLDHTLLCVACGHFADKIMED